MHRVVRHEPFDLCSTELGQKNLQPGRESLPSCLSRKFYRHSQQLPVRRIRDMDWRVDEEARCPRPNGYVHKFPRVLTPSEVLLQHLNRSPETITSRRKGRKWLLTRALFTSVIATKYTTNYRSGPAGEGSIMANYTGNSTKSLRSSIDASLKKLQTEYIDLVSEPTSLVIAFYSKPLHSQESWC